MAYFLSGSVIISDGRELIGVNTAGINTALFVGSDIQMDAATGIITAGIVTATQYYGDGSELINIPGLSWVASGEQLTRPDGTALQEGDIYYDEDDVRQYTYFTGDNGGWRDSNPAANAAISVTVGNSTASVIPGEETLTFAPDPADNEIVIGINTLTDTVTFGLADDVKITTSLEVGAGVSVYSGIVTSANGTPVQFFGDGSGLTGVGLESDSDVITSGDIQAGVITATTSLEATGAGVGLTVTNDAFVGGNITFEGTITGDGSGLTGVGLEADSDVITTGNIQAGIITATTSLEATVATGVGLTVTSEAWIGGNVTVIGDLEANDVNTTSDVTKKENIQEIEEALLKLKQLKGVTFDWIESGESSGGIIAQDVEQVLPTLVRQGDDHKTVIYNGIVGLLVQAVKELSAEVEELKHNN